MDREPLVRRARDVEEAESSPARHEPRAPRANRPARAADGASAGASATTSTGRTSKCGEVHEKVGASHMSTSMRSPSSHRGASCADSAPSSPSGRKRGRAVPRRRGRARPPARPRASADGPAATSKRPPIRVEAVGSGSPAPRARAPARSTESPLVVQSPEGTTRRRARAPRRRRPPRGASRNPEARLSARIVSELIERARFSTSSPDAERVDGRPAAPLALREAFRDAMQTGQFCSPSRPTSDCAGLGYRRGVAYKPPPSSCPRRPAGRSDLRGCLRRPDPPCGRDRVPPPCST